MAKTITVHSFRGGTGKSTIVANLATLLAASGKKVLLIDTDIKSPGIHALFGMDEGSFSFTFSDVLKKECAVHEAVYDVSETLGLKNGQLFILPSTMEVADIADSLLESYNYKTFKKVLKSLVTDLKLDYLLVDTHPGINEEMLVAAENTDALLLVLRPDNQDYQGAEVSADVADKLGAKTFLILNKIHRRIKMPSFKNKIEDAFGLPVIGAIPFSESVLFNESMSVFVQEYPRHVVTKAFKDLTSHVMRVV